MFKIKNKTNHTMKFTDKQLGKHLLVLPGEEVIVEKKPLLSEDLWEVVEQKKKPKKEKQPKEDE